ncbi:MAG TPA: hypothetical protein VGG54_22790 [Trebonia sp.]|jgi:hypothetical protein
MANDLPTLTPLPSSAAAAHPVIADIDAFISTLTEELPAGPNRYELLVHPAGYHAIALAATAKDAATWHDAPLPLSHAEAERLPDQVDAELRERLFGSPRGTCEIWVLPELAADAWELWQDDERVKTGRVG